MQYALLCYHKEQITSAWTKEEDGKVMADLAAVHGKIAQAGKLGPVVRLMPTTAGATVRRGSEEPLVIDGPFAETKEQLLGFYVVDCDSLDEALGMAGDLSEANPGGAYEVRPIAIYKPGELKT